MFRSCSKYLQHQVDRICSCFEQALCSDKRNSINKRNIRSHLRMFRYKSKLNAKQVTDFRYLRPGTNRTGNIKTSTANKIVLGSGIRTGLKISLGENAPVALLALRNGPGPPAMSSVVLGS